MLFRERIWYKIPNALFIKHLKTPPSVYLLWIIRTILVFLLIGIVAWPYMIKLEKVAKQPSSQILILLDISRSMLAEDIEPNRLSAAKRTLADFIRERKTDRIWLIIFAGKPILAIPFSSDYRGIIAFLENITPEYIHQEKDGLSGTNIGDALLLGNMTLSGRESNSSMILVTDGRANIGIDPRISLDESIQKRIPIYTVGISGNAWAELYYTDPWTGKKLHFYDEKGNILKNDIDETLLIEMATRTNGKYFRVNNTKELSQNIDTINAITKPQETVYFEESTSKYDLVFLVWVLLFLIIETTYRRHIWKKYHLL